jgi:hypothetical protein
MLLLLILVSSMVSTGFNDNVLSGKKKSDISNYGIRPIYSEGVKRNLGNILMWDQLLLEDFESGLIPPGWTVLDGNSDSYTWQIHSTSTWHPDAMPADSGNYIVGYDENAILDPAPAAEEELILPVLPSMSYDSIALIYSFGYQNNFGHDTFAVRVRTHNGISWGTWNNLVLYYSDMGSGLWDTLSLVPYLPADSFQIEFNWWDHRPSHSDWYVAVDNIEILVDTLAMYFDFSTDLLISPPALCRKDTLYEVLVAFSNNGTADTTVDLHIDINLEGVPVFSAASMGALIKADSTKVIDFGSFSFYDYGIFDYTAYAFSPLDLIPINDTLTGTGEVSPWEIVTSMPENLMDHAVVFDGNDIFVLGGRPVSGSSKAVYKYSPGGIWTLCDSMPVDLCMFDACVLGDTIYAPGGYCHSASTMIDTLFKYSISGDNWTSGPATGEPAWFYSCEAANGKVYRIGGYDNVSTLYSSTWEYDPSTGSWTKKTDMPLATELAVSWERNDSIYIAGGVDPSPMTYRNQTQIYDAVNDTWTMDSSFFAYLPSPRWGAGSAIYRDTVFIMSGVRPGGIITDSVFYYAFDGPNTWNTYPHVINSVYRTNGVGAEGVEDRFDGVYLFGGSTGGFNPISSVQARITYPASGIENQENENLEYLSIPTSISLNKISFSYNGNKATDIMVRDVTGRVVGEYTKVKPGSILNFGDGYLSGIYFISVKGTTECKKAILIR